MNRRDFLKALGIGTAALAIEPARKMWFVPSTAPVGSRVERFNGWELRALSPEEWRAGAAELERIDLTRCVPDELQPGKTYAFQAPPTQRVYWSKLPIGGDNGPWKMDQLSRMTGEQLRDLSGQTGVRLADLVVMKDGGPARYSSQAALDKLHHKLGLPRLNPPELERAALRVMAEPDKVRAELLNHESPTMRALARELLT